MSLINNLKALFLVFMVGVLFVIAYFVIIFGTILVLTVALFFFIRFLISRPQKETPTETDNEENKRTASTDTDP